MLKSTCWSCPELLPAFFHMMLKVAWVKVGAGLMSGYWQMTIHRVTLLQAEIVQIPLTQWKTLRVFSNGPVNQHMMWVWSIISITGHH